MTTPNVTKVPTHVLRALAVEAQADPRSVTRVLAGARVRGCVDDRIRAALAARGIAPGGTDVSK